MKNKLFLANLIIIQNGITLPTILVNMENSNVYLYWLNVVGFAMISLSFGWFKKCPLVMFVRYGFVKTLLMWRKTYKHNAILAGLTYGGYCGIVVFTWTYIFLK